MWQVTIRPTRMNECFREGRRRKEKEGLIPSVLIRRKIIQREGRNSYNDDQESEKEKSLTSSKSDTFLLLFLLLVKGN
jgi:hypothetical protein